MKILLFNDNPVVRKLVALSAQKTKDDLSVVWSVDEIEGSEYDLLIVDDALFSDEMFESLNEKISIKSTLFMATRGQAVPFGFQNVINKPFLPTDLVDMFVQIEKKVSASPEAKSDNKESKYAINLEESLPDLEGHEEELMEMGALDEMEDEFDVSSLEDFDEKFPETAILDQEEVQEVQGLLEETEDEKRESDDELSLSDDLLSEEMEDEILDFESVLDGDLLAEEGGMADKELLDEDEFADIEFSTAIEENKEAKEEEPLDEIDFSHFGEEDELLSTGEEALLDEEGNLDEMDFTSLLDDDDLGSLESKIEDAVGTLESEDLEQELETDDFEVDFDDAVLDELSMNEAAAELGEGDSENFDELDMLDERELKRAVGEEIEEEKPIVSVAKGDVSFVTEALDEVMSESFPFEEKRIHAEDEVQNSSPAEGVEALQALLKALSNENVAKSLKGMNISININFGNEK
jgi:uncharacterized membrane protein